MAGTRTSHPPGPSLPHAERLALWSLRHVLRPDSPRCALLPPLPCHGFAADLARVRTRFRQTADHLGGGQVAPIRIGPCHSLSLSADEILLLRCLAGLQCGRPDPDASLADILADRRLLMILTKALDERGGARLWRLLARRTGECRRLASSASGPFSAVIGIGKVFAKSAKIAEARCCAAFGGAIGRYFG